MNNRGIFLRCLCGTEEYIQAEFVINEHREHGNSNTLREKLGTCLRTESPLEMMCRAQNITSVYIREQVGVCCDEEDGLWMHDLAMCD